MSDSSQTHQQARPNGHRAGGRVAALLGAGSIIGMSGVWGRWGMRYGGMGGVAIAFWRLTLAVPVLAGWLFSGLGKRRYNVVGRPGVDRRAVVIAVFAGLFFAGDMALYFIAIDYTTIANATLMSNCAPILVALVAWPLLGERFGKVFVVGLVLTVAGAGVLGMAERMTVRAAESATHSQSLTGDMLALASAVFYAGYQICIKRARKSLDTATSMTISVTVSSVALLACTLALGEQILPTAAIGWAIVAGLAIGSQLLGQCVIAWAVGRLSVSFASVGMLVQAIMAAVFGWILLGESLGALHMVGAAAVLAGIYLANSGSAIDDPLAPKSYGR